MKKMKWNQFLLAGLQLFAEDGGDNGGVGADVAGADGGADRPADRSAAGRDPLPAAGEGGDEHGAGYGAHQHTVRR